MNVIAPWNFSMEAEKGHGQKAMPNVAKVFGSCVSNSRTRQICQNCNPNIQNYVCFV